MRRHEQLAGLVKGQAQVLTGIHGCAAPNKNRKLAQVYHRRQWLIIPSRLIGKDEVEFGRN
jgi:hypothetical protein